MFGTLSGNEHERLPGACTNCARKGPEGCLREPPRGGPRYLSTPVLLGPSKTTACCVCNTRINPAMPILTEDDIYRTSTQYRLWSFTRESLSSLRSATNQSAADGVRAALKSIHSQQTAGESEGQSSHDEATRPTNYVKEVDCLTVEEELKLVGFYCVKTMQFADFCEFPTNVKVKRFLNFRSESPCSSLLAP